MAIRINRKERKQLKETKNFFVFSALFAVIFSGACFSALSADTRSGDSMIEGYLRQETEKIESKFLEGITSLPGWQQALPQYRQQYFEMLGLWPLPEKTPLHATITRTLDRGDYKVDMIHYQSRPGLYVTGNLYRPAAVPSGERLPAIFYVCGHAMRGRNGNKTAYQSHGIWFAKHGYICLTVDTLQLGEIAGIHHGTYREGRWWWLSRGYTPAGVECWNGIRGIDYLITRSDVDPERIGVTGISGGGAATTWIAAADERAKVAMPVSGMSDLRCYVPDHVVNEHCDCMFMYNTYQWPWARILALIAPRPLLFVNSDQDSLFPMKGNERVINRLERVYSLYGAGDRVDSLASIGGHAYRKDIRQAEYRFFNTYFKNDPRTVLDSEVDLVSTGADPIHPIPPEQLRVFPQDSDLPTDARNGRIDQEFVPEAVVKLPQTGQFAAWKAGLLMKLRQLTFPHFPERIEPARPLETNAPGLVRLETEAGIVVTLRQIRAPDSGAGRIWLLAAQADDAQPSWMTELITQGDGIYTCEARGLGETRWTRKNPPNYVERSHYLLGRTVDSGRIWDLAAAARYIRSVHQRPVWLAGEGASGVLTIYAALLEPDVEGVGLSRPVASHMEETAPALLNVLRVCDIPDALGMLAPRRAIVIKAPNGWGAKPADIYQAAGTSDNLSFK